MNAAIIVAAGASRRFKAATPKQFMKLGGLPVFLWSVLAFKKTGKFGQIILVVPKDRVVKLKIPAAKYGFEAIPGGKERADSVHEGIKKLKPGVKIVAIHDGARPLVSKGLILRSLEAAKKFGAAVAAVPANDTVKICSGLKVLKTTPRTNVWLAQTPQVFARETIEYAFKKLRARKGITDDAQIAELAGKPVRVVPGESTNIKLTTKKDFDIAVFLLKTLRSGKKCT